MLTKDLLLYRSRKGIVRPRFVDSQAPQLLELATELLGMAQNGIGESKKDIEDTLKAQAKGYPDPKVALGLCKLMTDRMVFEEPVEEAEAERQARFKDAAQIFRALGEDASLETYEAELARAWAEPLPDARESLYADLKDRRKLIEIPKLSATALLNRYNLALVQGLLIYAHRVTVETVGTDLPTLRKVLRWLKFCRLVTDFKRDGNRTVLTIEGPAAILSMQKKYGLELANFALAVPLLQTFSLSAEVQIPRKKPWKLVLSHEDGLVSSLRGGTGHVPPEFELIAQSFKDGEWVLDLVPEPRNVGTSSVCVPDLFLRHTKKENSVAVELFHTWHRHALTRRLKDLTLRPDPKLLLGVERSLLKSAEEADGIESHPQVFAFRHFPTERVLRKALGQVPTSK